MLACTLPGERHEVGVLLFAQGFAGLVAVAAGLGRLKLTVKTPGAHVFIDGAQLDQSILDRAGLSRGGSSAWGGTRRLAVRVEDVPAAVRGAPRFVQSVRLVEICT